jgi:uncharacterized Fe-S cluster-containing radical SAM superfamily enzyme
MIFRLILTYDSPATTPPHPNGRIEPRVPVGRSRYATRPYPRSRLHCSFRRSQAPSMAVLAGWIEGELMAHDADWAIATRTTRGILRPPSPAAMRMLEEWMQ